MRQALIIMLLATALAPLGAQSVNGVSVSIVLPNPGTSTLGGIQSLAAVTSKWINAISTSGVPAATQPAFTDISGTATNSQMPTTVKTKGFGVVFDGLGVALTAGKTVYTTISYACTISAWNMTVDAGTATVDIWKVATGTAVPTVTNTIVASAAPAVSTGTALHSTTLTGWTTSVTANDVIGLNLKTVATAKLVNLDVQCDQ